MQPESTDASIKSAEDFLARNTGCRVEVTKENETDEPVLRAESDAFFDWYDTDWSGAVDMEELLEMVASFKQVDSNTLNQAKIKQVWNADGDGTVCCAQVL